MSRYIGADEVDFTDINGRTININEMREIPDYLTLSNYDILAQDDIDEIMSRQQFYGDGAEDLSYACIEANKIKLDEINYDLSKIKTLIIPVVE